MNISDVRKVIVAAIEEATGLDSGKVVWSDQDTNQVNLPYCALTLSGLSSPSLAGVVSSTDLTRPAGKEIQLQVIGYEEGSLGLEVYTDATVDSPDQGASALGILYAARAALYLPGVTDRVNSKGIAFFDLTGQIDYRPEIVSVGFRGRATWDVRVRIPIAHARELTGYIETANMTASIDDASGLPIPGSPLPVVFGDS